MGLALLVLWVGALQMMLDKGKELDWFAVRPRSSMLAVVAAVGFVVFVIWELTDEHPVVDLRLFAQPQLRVGALALSMAYGLFFGNVVLLPLWLQQRMGYTATEAGMALAPVGLLAILLMPLVGRSRSAHRPAPRWRPPLLVFCVACVAMRSLFNLQADLGDIADGAHADAGRRDGVFFIPLITITLAGLPPDRMPAASGLSNFVRITAGAFGHLDRDHAVGATAPRCTTRISAEQVVEGRAVVDGSLEGLRSAGFDQDQALALVNRLADQQSFTLSTVELNYASSAVFLLLLALVWSSRPPQPVRVRSDERRCRAASDRTPERSPAGAGHLRAF